MDSAEVLVAALTIVFSLGFFVVYAILLYWTIKFLTSVPKHLEQIAQYLKEIANK